MKKEIQAEAENGSFRVWYDEKRGVGRIVNVGLADEYVAGSIRDAILEIGEEKKEPVDWICDLRKATTATSEARVIFKDILGHPSVNRVVYYGGSRLMRFMANSLLRLANKRNGYYVADEATALRFLNKKRQQES